MSSLFGKPKVSAPAQVVEEDVDVGDQTRRRARRLRSQRSSTIFGGEDTLGQSATLGTKRLLGG